MSEVELAAMVGVSETTWKSHKAAGCPVPKSRAGLPAWAKRYNAWRKANGKFERGGGAAPAGDPELQKHKRELAKLRAMDLQLQLDERSAQMIPRAAVVNYASEAVLAVVQQLDAATRRIAARLGPQSQGGAAAVESVVRAELDMIRDRFSKSMARTHERS